MVKEKVDFFYAYDSLIASTNLVCMQWGFEIIIGIFEWVGIRTNVEKTMDMVCQTGNISGRHSNTDYGRRMTGKGDHHHVKQCRRLACGECGVELDAAYTSAHLQKQHER